MFAGLAASIALTYRGSGIINMATGALVDGRRPTRCGDSETDRFGFKLPMGVAVPAAVLAAVLVGVISEFLVFRALRTASPLAKLLASLGIMLVLQSGAVLWFGAGPREIPNILPKSNISLFDHTVQLNRFWISGTVVVVALLLGALFRWTRFGLATRASAGERGLRDARRVVPEPTLDGQRDLGVGLRWADGNSGRADCAG